MCIKERIVHLASELILLNSSCFGDYHPFQYQNHFCSTQICCSFGFVINNCLLEEFEVFFTILSQNSSWRNVVPSWVFLLHHIQLLGNGILRNLNRKKHPVCLNVEINYYLVQVQRIEEYLVDDFFSWLISFPAHKSSALHFICYYYYCQYYCNARKI